MKLKNFKITHKGLYWGLIITFAILYLCVGFVSTLHSITFFGLANSIGLAVLLGLTYEVGQASVLFSILMTKNKDKFLPWALMFLLTALQVTANVYASFKFMANSGSTDWTYWQKSILFGVQAANAEMYQVIISWIAGALLPVVALGMTALVANNMKMMSEEAEAEEKPKDVVKEILENESKNIEILKEEEIKLESPEPDKWAGFNLSREEQLEKFKDKVLSNIHPQTKMEEKPIIGEGGVEVIKPQFEVNLQSPKSIDVDGVEWEARPADLIGNTMGKLPNFQFTPSPPPAPEVSPDKLDEIVENEVKRRLQEIEDKKGIEKANEFLQQSKDILAEAKDSLDEEVERLSPIETETKIVDVQPSSIQIPEENLPEVSQKPINITDPEILKEAEKAAIREITLETQTKEIKPALFKTDAEGKLEQTPLTKTRGWHLKKTYVDSNGDVYHFGKISDDKELKEKPEEPKKA
jgi:hypothetical protein